MKTPGKFILLLLLFTTSEIAAQEISEFRTGRKWSAFGVKAQNQNFGLLTERKNDTVRKITHDGNVGILASYYRNANSFFAFALNAGGSFGRVATATRPTALAKSQWFFTYAGDIFINLANQGSPVSPFLHAGFNMLYSTDEEKGYGSIPVGGGLRFTFKNSPLMLNAQIDYGFGASRYDMPGYLNTSVGVYVKLGKQKRVEKKPARVIKDSDADGIPDEADKCPFIFGSKDNNGCPCDSDEDGVVDLYDNCPQTPGPIENRGCPTVDTDHDGVPDYLDKCPQIAGLKNNDGCPEPDRDGDGIADSIDKCPDTKGVAVNNGCPAVALPPTNQNSNSNTSTNSASNNNNTNSNNTTANSVDSDNDGVPDSEDRCPHARGSKHNAGCPENVMVEVAPRAIVYYDYDKYEIRPDAAATLSQVAEFMKNNPNYRVALTGHTDNKASDGYNQILSKNRVNSAKQYLLSFGIPAHRISTTFFGKSKPAASALSETDHAKNRRVEFIFINN